jgi:hypothetical protein
LNTHKKLSAFGVLIRVVSGLTFALLLALALSGLCQEADPAETEGMEEEMEALDAQAETTAAALDESLRAEVELPFEREIFVYEVDARRDPFTPLVPKEEGAEPNVENLTLNGIIWGFGGPMAVVKEKGATGHVLRKGDKVSGGEVEDITMESITFRLSEFGIVTRYTLTLKGEGRK